VVGRPGSAEPATSPAVAVDADTGEPPPPQEIGTQTDLLAINREVPVVNFLNADECELRESNIPNCFHFASSQWYTKYIRVPILVDTGAEVSVLSTEFVQRLFPEQDIPTGTRQVRALGDQLFTLKGPLKLKVEVTATHAPQQRCQQRTSSAVSYALDPEAPVFTPHSAQSQPSVTHSHTPGTPSTDFLNHSPPQTMVHTINDTSDDLETFVEAAVDTETELPEHVNILFLQTVEQNNLSSDVSHGLIELLKDHSDTFAKSSTDLGYCDLLQHDLDTGDSPPIRQSPRRPPLAARDAEDTILDEMLESGVIEPSNSSWVSPCLPRKEEGWYLLVLCRL